MNLAIIGQLPLVAQLFGTIFLPEEVWRELTLDGKGKPGCEAIEASPWIKVVKVENRALVRLLSKDLDRGEAAAISLALETRTDLILLDETDARDMAEIYQLKKTGVLGILIKAKPVESSQD